ncbi:hypothetical protein FM038_020150 [Shewanella eurypsychrophilus]|uniref:Uncharacterized protein n=1 Tax=Shewanella eurypsychrophilus TaxID=2593656 RepID=A0ABX6VC14_9GAMM|nr:MULTISPECIES: hypothetical protein [Shewanella]QFU24236.1 hypothetical protein FS418_21875 [Shewanella sp. YLB-09]QPG59441.1 hypothetical protein FM038_020150 [Shewanella eurypsychrophilus]
MKMDMLVNLYRAISFPERERIDIQADFTIEEAGGRLAADIVTISDAATRYQLDKKALDSVLGGLLHSKNKNIYELSVANEDEGLSVIEKQIERIKEELERLKLELRAISGDNSQNAKLERKIIQEQMMLLTVEMMSLLERKMNSA